MSVATGAAQTQRPSGWLLPAAAAVTGIAGAGALVAMQRHLGLEAITPVAQLWTIWAVMAAGLTFAFQQWSAAVPAKLGDLAQPQNRAIVAALGAIALCTWIATWVFSDRLFQTSHWVWPVAATALPLGTALNGVARGSLAAAFRHRRLAAAIAGENLIRLTIVLLLVAIGAAPAWFAVALLGGFAVIGLAFNTLPETTPTNTTDPTSGTSSSLAASAGAGVASYAFMFGSPIILGLAGGDPAEVSALFLVLAAARLPFVGIQAIVPQLTVKLTHDDDALVHRHRTRKLVGAAAIVGTAAAAGSGWMLGDILVGTVFDIRGRLEPSVYSMLAGAALLSACALLATVVLAAEGRSKRILATWGTAAATTPVFLLGSMAEVRMIAAWLFCVHAMVAAIALLPPKRKNP